MTSDKCLFSDLDSDPEIFQGDTNVNFQYEMYRIMKNLVYKNAADKQNPPSSSGVSPWSFYCPKTNAAWIWFIMKYILTPKLATFKKITALKKSFIQLTNSLHDDIVFAEESSCSLKQWYLNNKNSFDLS